MRAGGRLALEIAVAGPAGARIARECGADRVELSAALELGGVTPSCAMVEAVCAVGPPVHVLVRCRPGDFVYDAEEVALMAAEVRAAVAAGAAGVVVGALTADGALDTGAMRRLLDAAAGTGAGVEVTLHRAVDQAADPSATAVLAASLGVDRILTSGGAVDAPSGAATIAAMAAAVPGTQVMAGAGVRPGDVPALAATGAAAVHLSAKRPAPPRGSAPRVPLGTSAADTHYLTAPDIVTAARAAVDAANGRAQPPR